MATVSRCVILIWILFINIHEYNASHVQRNSLTKKPVQVNTTLKNNHVLYNFEAAKIPVTKTINLNLSKSNTTGLQMVFLQSLKPVLIGTTNSLKEQKIILLIKPPKYSNTTFAGTFMRNLKSFTTKLLPNASVGAKSTAYKKKNGELLSLRITLFIKPRSKSVKKNHSTISSNSKLQSRQHISHLKHSTESDKINISETNQNATVIIQTVLSQLLHNSTEQSENITNMLLHIVLPTNITKEEKYSLPKSVKYLLQQMLPNMSSNVETKFTHNQMGIDKVDFSIHLAPIRNISSRIHNLVNLTNPSTNIPDKIEKALIGILKQTKTDSTGRKNFSLTILLPKNEYEYTPNKTILLTRTLLRRLRRYDKIFMQSETLPVNNSHFINLEFHLTPILLKSSPMKRQRVHSEYLEYIDIDLTKPGSTVFQIFRKTIPGIVRKIKNSLKPVSFAFNIKTPKNSNKKFLRTEICTLVKILTDNIPSTIGAIGDIVISFTVSPNHQSTNSVRSSATMADINGEDLKEYTELPKFIAPLRSRNRILKEEPLEWNDISSNITLKNIFLPNLLARSSPLLMRSSPEEDVSNSSEEESNVKPSSIISPTPNSDELDMARMAPSFNRVLPSFQNRKYQKPPVTIKPPTVMPASEKTNFLETKPVVKQFIVSMSNLPTSEEEIQPWTTKNNLVSQLKKENSNKSAKLTKLQNSIEPQSTTKEFILTMSNLPSSDEEEEVITPPKVSNSMMQLKQYTTEKVQTTEIPMLISSPTEMTVKPSKIRRPKKTLYFKWKTPKKNYKKNMLYSPISTRTNKYPKVSSRLEAEKVTSTILPTKSEKEISTTITKNIPNLPAEPKNNNKLQNSVQFNPNSQKSNVKEVDHYTKQFVISTSILPESSEIEETKPLPKEVNPVMHMKEYNKNESYTEKAKQQPPKEVKPEESSNESTSEAESSYSITTKPSAGNNTRKLWNYNWRTSKKNPRKKIIRKRKYQPINQISESSREISTNPTTLSPTVTKKNAVNQQKPSTEFKILLTPRQLINDYNNWENQTASLLDAVPNAEVQPRYNTDSIESFEDDSEEENQTLKPSLLKPEFNSNWDNRTFISIHNMISDESIENSTKSNILNAKYNVENENAILNQTPNSSLLNLWSNNRQLTNRQYIKTTEKQLKFQPENEHEIQENIDLSNSSSSMVKEISSLILSDTEIIPNNGKNNIKFVIRINPPKNTTIESLKNTSQSIIPILKSNLPSDKINIATEAFQNEDGELISVQMTITILYAGSNQLNNQEDENLSDALKGDDETIERLTRLLKLLLKILEENEIDDVNILKQTTVNQSVQSNWDKLKSFSENELSSIIEEIEQVVNSNPNESHNFNFNIVTPGNVGAKFSSQFIVTLKSLLHQLLPHDDITVVSRNGSNIGNSSSLSFSINVTPLTSLKKIETPSLDLDMLPPQVLKLNISNLIVDYLPNIGKNSTVLIDFVFQTTKISSFNILQLKHIILSSLKSHQMRGKLLPDEVDLGLKKDDTIILHMPFLVRTEYFPSNLELNLQDRSTSRQLKKIHENDEDEHPLEQVADLILPP